VNHGHNPFFGGDGKMLRVVLIDDEQSCLNQLERGLGGIVEIVGQFTDPLDALSQIKTLQADAVFLDIEMPGLDGFAVALEILNKAPGIGIVFVTAHRQFALKAFELDAVDYILKPFSVERLGEAIIRLERKVALSSQEKARVRESIYRKVVETKPQRVILWRENHAFLARTSKIACCFVEKARRGVTVIVEGAAYKSSNSFSELLERIGPKCLVRCHRSFAINPDYLLELSLGRNHTMLAKVAGYQAEIPISRQFSPVFRNIVELPMRLPT
jgi:two-component system LytT family response regulator/two-component system response regulator LytT